MQLIRSMLCALALCALAAGACASPADPKAGVEYLVLPVAQNTEPDKAVEVIEFFAYYCPHCNAFEPVLAGWLKRQGANVVFKRVHVSRDISVAPQQRLFFTLEALGLLEQYHARVFSAMHEQRLRLSSDEQVFDWAEQAGIERKKFIDAYRSFGVQAKLRRADAMMGAYHIDQWPMLAIDGRWLTSPSQANEGMSVPQSEQQQQQSALQVMDILVARAKAEKK
ncbi:MAG: thiol:disulfide interchange protein DsbA/DsbL [Pseudomonadota bacterium]